MKRNYPLIVGLSLLFALLIFLVGFGPIQCCRDVSARVFNDAPIPVPDTVVTPLTFNSELFDSTNNIHSTVSNTNRLTAPANGKYYIYGTVQFESNGNGLRHVWIRFHGADGILDIAGQRTPAVIDASEGTFLNISTHYFLSAGEWVELLAYQTSGETLNVTVSSYASPHFGMVKVP
ncbi:MAG: hypothetical protein AB1791_17050 [Chloroflexota bacterium]